MAGVKSVRQLDDTHLHWEAEVWGKDKEWDAEITEQVPDQVIAWRSTSGDAPNAGAVRFEQVAPERTRDIDVSVFVPDEDVDTMYFVRAGARRSRSSSSRTTNLPFFTS